MAERPVDKLLPQSLALVAGVAALAVAGAGVIADFVIGRPSSTAALGIVVMFPLALFAAIVGFALGHFVGFLLRKAHVNPALPMKAYRVGMALGLAAVAVTGAAAGARPVIRHERLHQPRVIAGAERVDKQTGTPDTCNSMERAPVACDLLTGQTSSTLSWNGRDVALACTRDGLITISDQSGGLIASADLRSFEYLRQVQAAAARQRDGREGFVVLARLRATGRREMLVIFNADGQVAYQELLAASREIEQPLSMCRGDDVDSPVVDAGSPVMYRSR